MTLAAVVLAAMLAIVAYGVRSGGGFAKHVADLAGRTSRRRMVFGWAAGTCVTYGLSSVLALALIGRIDALAAMPVALQVAAWRMGLPGASDAGALAWLGGCLALGMALGGAIFVARRHRGRGAIGLRYRSPAAVRGPGEWPAAVTLALAAGVCEELFFRVAMPLLFALVLGWGVAGFAFALAAFVALHRHQGVVGMIAVAVTGAALTYLYLLTGHWWVAAILHVVIDLNALVFRPMLFPARD